MITENKITKKIIEAFLRLVAERGFEATTTRDLAQAAAVNEVTIFRHFGDKTNLMRHLLHHYNPAARLDAYQSAFDSDSKAEVRDGLIAALVFLRDQMQTHPEIMHFGVGEYWRLPELATELAATPRSARTLIERILQRARPSLRPEVDLTATALSLLGLVFVAVSWQ